MGGWGPGDVTKEAGVEAEEASLEGATGMEKNDCESQRQKAGGNLRLGMSRVLCAYSFFEGILKLTAHRLQ